MSGDLRLRPGNRDVHRAVEKSFVERTALLCLGLGPLIHLLEDSGDHQQHGRLEAIKVGREVLNVRGVADNHTGVQGQHLNQASQHVGQRQEENRRVAGVCNLAFHEARVGAQIQEIAVGERATLGAAGRAGGVHNGRDVIAGGAGACLLKLFVADLGSTGAQLIQVAVLNDPAVLQLHGLFGGCGKLLGLFDATQQLLVLDEDRGGLGVGERPGGLGGGIRFVDRHGDSTGVPDGEVDYGPLEAGTAHNAHAVTRADTRGNHALRQVGHHAVKLAGAYRLPIARGHLATVQHGVRAVGAVTLNEAREVQRGVDNDLCGGRKDFHDAPFGWGGLCTVPVRLYGSRGVEYGTAPTG